MSLIFHIPTGDESAARNRAADLASMVALEPVRVELDRSDVRVEVHHPLALLLSSLTELLCRGCGRLSRFLCPRQDAGETGRIQGV